MKKSASLPYARRLAWLSLIVVLALSACSPNRSENIPAAREDLLAARPAAENAGSALPKSDGAPYAPAAAPEDAAAQAAQAANAGAGAQGSLAAQGSAQLAQAQPNPAAALLPDAAAVVPNVDLSLPVEPAVGSRAPDFTLQTLDGQTVRMADLLGRPVVISYWATWCIPCKQELPVLNQLYQEYRERGLVVLSVNATDQDDLQSVQSMAAEMGMSFPVLLDDGKNFSESYQAMFFPSTFFVDPNGVIRFIRLGDSSEEFLRDHVEGLLAGTL